MNITIYPTCEHYNTETKKCTAYSDELCPREGMLEVEVYPEEKYVNRTHREWYTYYCDEIGGEKCCEGWVDINLNITYN